MATALMIIAGFFAVAFVVLAMVITHEVSKRGIKINILWLRLYLIKYIHQYRLLTKRETGRVGPLYYPCLISVNLALVLFLVSLFV